MAVKNPMTYEELMDNYEFKVSRKMLITEYPWIKDVTYKTPESLNKYSLIFIDLVIDPYELAEEYGWKIIWYVNRRIKDGDFPNYTYLSVLFEGPESTDGARELQNHIDRELTSVHKSPAIPQELKLPEGRKLNIGGIYIDPNSTPPPQASFYPQSL